MKSLFDVITKHIDDTSTLVKLKLAEKKDKHKSFMEMVRDYGYPLEKYFYETKDNYINCVFRIRGPKGTQINSIAPRNVIIYQHGLLDSSAGICCDGTNSMAFFFADAGFDVWMNNSRGNRYSKHHKFLDPDVHQQYWDFSFEELGNFDQPALFDFVLEKTGVPNVTYIGHSQGTTQMFSALSENQEFFRPKINLAIMLAPVARVDRANNVYIEKVKSNEEVFKLLEKTGPELFPDPQINGYISSGFMKVTGMGEFGIQQMSDSDSSSINQNALTTFMGYFPAGTSVRCVAHFRQLALSKSFQHYDHGSAFKNMEVYGTPSPPQFNLQNITNFPIALMCGQTDRLASPPDYMWLKEELTKSNSCVFFREYTFGHIGFLNPLSPLHFYDMLALCQQYSPSYSSGMQVDSIKNKLTLMESQNFERIF